MSGDRQMRRGLSTEDRALWNEVRKSIKPLRVRTDNTPADKPAEEKSRTRKKPPVPRSAAVPHVVNRPPPLAPMDRRARQRLARGRSAIDERLDLHGLTQERAFPRLRAFLEKAQSRESSLVLVITGKGGGTSADRFEGERGVLRRQVPMWLALPELRPLVVGFEQAAPVHGGAGALYVRIRRRRD